MSAFIDVIAKDASFSRYEAVLDKDRGPKRCIILDALVYDMIRLKGGTLADGLRIEFNSQLTAFTAGNRITVVAAAHPKGSRKTPHSDIKGLQDHDFVLWEYKFRKPTPYRLIGVVPQEDTFVGITLLPRAGLPFRNVCNSTLARYYTLLGSKPCTAIKSHNANDAFTNWRHPR